VPLVEATLLSNDDCQITITVRNKTKNASHKTTLHHLRTKAIASWPKVDAVEKKPCPKMWTSGLGQVAKVNEPKFIVGKKIKAELEDTRQAEAGRKKKRTKKGMGAEPEYPVGGNSYEVFQYLQWKVREAEGKSKEAEVGKGKKAVKAAKAGGKRK
jgi:hypothetical protein